MTINTAGILLIIHLLWNIYFFIWIQSIFSPNGYKCDTKDGRCLKGDVSLPFYQKIKAIAKKLETVPCADGKSECPDGSTCCQLADGQYGCCPLVNVIILFIFD